MPLSLRLLPLALLVLAACPSPGPGSPDAGSQEIPDLCDTAEEALTSSECELVLGATLERYISVPGDKDWYSVRMPATLGPRALLRVQAGYAVQSTAVNLSVSLLREDGQQAVAERQVDAHGQGAPRPVEIIIPFSEPGARLLLLLGDEPAIPSRPAFDTRAPYFLKVEVLENPDANEPNDTTPTPLALADQGGVLLGSATGYLATKGDVDQF
ncbi:MAG TPA: cell-cell cohesion protein MtsF, partial [Myxococcaceae bacterium]|nr:cell-cell cohesion protein MtsF [Myxococcaceae bacterium]